MRTIEARWMLTLLLGGCGGGGATGDGGAPDQAMAPADLAAANDQAAAPDQAAPPDLAIAWPNVPMQIAVTEMGDSIKLRAPAKGAQVYTCTATGGGDGGVADGGATTYAWVFSFPDATLYADDAMMNAIGKHSAGPTWQLTADGSSIQGMKTAAATPDMTAIPWLLLKGVNPMGNGLLSGVHWIQRTFTVGGLAPSGGCNANTVGMQARVDYTAVYYFYGP